MSCETEDYVNVTYTPVNTGPLCMRKYNSPLILEARKNSQKKTKRHSYNLKNNDITKQSAMFCVNYWQEMKRLQLDPDVDPEVDQELMDI